MDHKDTTTMFNPSQIQNNIFMKRIDFYQVCRKMACDEEEMDGEDEVVLNEEHLRMWEREREQEM